MSVHVNFETPEQIQERVYDLVKKLARDGKGRVKKGMNEVIKVSERGDAKLVVMAEDVNPGELLAHIPLICGEKKIPFGYVPSQEFLAKECGMPNGTRTASVAILEISKSAQEKFNEVVELVNNLSE